MARKEGQKDTNLRLYFTGYVFAMLCLTVAAASLITYLLNAFVTASVIIPTLMWMVLFSLVLGAAITAFLSKRLFNPISQLSAAIREVAAGDFSVRLPSGGRFKQVRETYDNFNLMVQELGATETLQSDFISNVSHEFKTPINAIEGYAMLLQDQHQTPEEHQEYVEKILFNTRRLSELVGNILLLSKVDNQAIQAAKAPYRLDEQIRQAILALEQKWNAKQIEFVVELEPITYRGNESLLLHVWTNLIDNAIKFDPFGGEVDIRLYTAGGQAVCTVKDSGPGIPPDVQAHIFDRFYQAESSHQSEGNGLGLALVKRIVGLAGGDVRVESQPDCGATFTVSLP